MANGQTVILSSPYARQRAHRLIDAAPDGCVANVRQMTRTGAQNDKLWAMLSDLSRAKPQGRCHPSHVWKGLVMDMAGHKPVWEPSLDGSGVVCVGYKSSRLTVAEMSDLIEQMYAYGAEHGVVWTDEAMVA